MSMAEIPEPIYEMVSALSTLKHVEGIVLGGSRARGTATENSDFDIGVYFNSDTPLDVYETSRVLANHVDDGTPSDLTPIGEWGPWIIGGGWITVKEYKVDILYRRLDEVRRMIHQCCSGRLTIDYQPGHPHGVTSALWMGEIALCKVLYDPYDNIKPLKRLTVPFPPALQEAIANRFLWEIGFSISIAEKAVGRGDFTYFSGCAFRALSCLAQVLFAANKQYLINEKAALLEAASFPITITNLNEKIERIWADIGAGNFKSALDALTSIDLHVRKLITEL